MASRRVMVIALAPVAPPCFPTRTAWLEYLAAAAEAQTTKAPGPLDLRKGEPVFNFRHDFCAPCGAKYALAMQRQGLCKPQHLREMAPAPAAQKERL